MARDNTRKDSGKKDFPSKKIISPPIRLSYPHLFDPNINDQDQEVWETEALIPPTDEGYKFLDQLEATLTEMMEEYFGPEDEWPRGRNDYAPADKIKKVTEDKIPGPGITTKWHKFTARSYAPVGVVDASRNEVLNKREAYGGRWARLSLTITVYDNKSKGPAIYLNNVQLLSNDESFGGRPAAQNDFDEWEGEDLSGGGGGSRRGRDEDDDRGNRSRSREDRDERGAGRDRDRDSRDSRRGDDRASTRSRRDENTERGGRGGDRDRGRERDRGEDRDSRPSRRGSDREEIDREAREDRDERPSRSSRFEDESSRDENEDWS